MPQVTLNGDPIHYTQQGTGLPVVLVHGFPLDSRIFDAQVAALSDKYRVITIDLPGFGQSPSSKPFTVASMADDLHAILRQIDAFPCVLGGLSMGGYIALGYVIKYPSTLRGLMLIDTKAEADTAEGKAGRDKMIQSVREFGSQAAANAMEPRMLAPEAAQSRPDLLRQVCKIMTGCRAQTVEYALAAMRDRIDYSSELPSIPVPTLIIVGDADQITPPKVAQAMQTQIPQAQLTIIKGAGHLSTMEQPEQVNRAMREFLGKLHV
jgi:3-oxoadipate enol-lactonase